MVEKTCLSCASFVSFHAGGGAAFSFLASAHVLCTATFVPTEGAHSSAGGAIGSIDEVGRLP